MGLKRIVDADGHKRDVSDPKQRALMQHIVRLRDEECMTFHAISDEVARKCLIAGGQKVVSGSLSEWNEVWCRYAYASEKKLQARGL